jgi:hypothetical protein
MVRTRLPIARRQGCPVTRRLRPDPSLIQERKRYVLARKREAVKDKSKTQQRIPGDYSWRNIVKSIGEPS